MNEDRIREVGEIAALAHLPEGDPRLVEALRSPQKRALIALYRDFLTQPPAGPLPGADFADADARLAATLDRELAPVAETGARPARSAAEPKRSFLDGLFAPAFRPALAFAALALVAGTAWLTLRPTPAPEGGVMRGETAPLRSEIADQNAGRALLTWTTVAGAERYELRFFGTDLAERARIPLGTETRYEVLASHVPAGLASGEVVLWQVVALKGNDVLQESPTATLRVP